MNKVKFYKIYDVDEDGRMCPLFQVECSIWSYEVGKMYVVSEENRAYRDAMEPTHEAIQYWKEHYGYELIGAKDVEWGYFGINSYENAYRLAWDYLGSPTYIEEAFDHESEDFDYVEAFDESDLEYMWPFNKNFVIVECEGTPLCYDEDHPYPDDWFERCLPDKKEVYSREEWWERYRDGSEVQFFDMKILRVVEHMQVDKMVEIGFRQAVWFEERLNPTEVKLDFSCAEKLAEGLIEAEKIYRRRMESFRKRLHMETLREQKTVYGICEEILCGFCNEVWVHYLMYGFDAEVLYNCCNCDDQCRSCLQYNLDFITMWDNHIVGGRDTLKKVVEIYENHLE